MSFHLQGLKNVDSFQSYERLKLSIENAQFLIDIF